MKIRLLVILFLASSTTLFAQEAKRVCGTELIKQRLIDLNPAMEQAFRQTLESNVQYSIELAENTNNAAYKTTATAPIPVVFHIVLNEAQITQLGGTGGIEQRIESQINSVNLDFNAQNSDSASIPDGFKPLFGNAGVTFALAHTKPDGSSTPGYEIITTTADGIEESGTSGSRMGYSDAKFINGIANAWNPEKYLNIWIVNPLNNGAGSSILGLTIPPSFAGYGIPGFSNNELGIVLNYGAFGTRTGIGQYFISGITGGRTLTHELGHYFELWHIWGDDKGACAGSGGKDDGIADTPPQADATYGCAIGKRFDACTPAGEGIMYMNYMDYVNDNCMHMFTKMQADVIKGMIASGKESYALHQNPELVLYPASVGNMDAAQTFNVYPNPSEGMVHISVKTDVLSVYVFDMQGKLVAGLHPKTGERACTLDMSNAPKGVYFIQCNQVAGSNTQKIVIR